MTDSSSWPPQLDARRAAQIRSVVMAEVHDQAAPRRRRRRILTVVAGAAAVLLAGAGTATAVLLYAQPDQANLGYCAPVASLDRAVWDRYAFGAVQAPDGTWQTLDAVEACAAMRQAGVLGAEFQDGGANAPDELTACIVEGDLVVFPGGSGTCRRLGIPDAAVAP
jgi:hypothetical protein